LPALIAASDTFWEKTVVARKEKFYQTFQWCFRRAFKGTMAQDFSPRFFPPDPNRHA
jgi:hypothetical protein